MHKALESSAVPWLHFHKIRRDKVALVLEFSESFSMWFFVQIHGGKGRGISYSKTSS